MSRYGRRRFLASTLGFTVLALSGCFGRRSDPSAVADALNSAVTTLPVYVDGAVQFQDSVSAGTTIGGVLTLDGGDFAEVAESLKAILETIIRTYVEQPGADTAFVRVEGHPQSDQAVRVLAVDVVPASNGANVTTDDLIEYFDV